MFRNSSNLINFVMSILGLMLMRTQTASAQGFWTAVAPIPTARVALGAATGADGRIYAIGGDNGTGNGIATAEAYDPITNTWSTFTSMPTARRGLGVVLGSTGLIYAIGGVDNAGNAVGTVEAYYPNTDTWSTMTSMPTSRLYFGMTTGLDGRIYAIDGVDNSNNVFNTVEAYDPITDTWSTLTSTSTARQTPAAATGLDGRIYVFGGEDNAGNVFNTVEAYDPSTNTWNPVVSMPIACHDSAAVTGPDGRIYVLGGATGSALSSVISTVQVYDPGTNSWSTVTSLPTVRANMGAALGFDGRIYSISGSDDSNPWINMVDAYTSITVSKLTISPSTVPGSLKTIGTVTLSAPVAMPQRVTLTTTNPAASVPAYVMVPTGAKSASFTITTVAVTTTQTGIVTASYGGVSKSATLKVRPIGVKSVTIVPNPILGGYNTIGVVTLEAPAAPGDITVTLSSSNTVVATPDASLTIPAGEINGCFNINTTAVSATTYVTIYATANGIKKSKTLKVVP